jgi:hypothetical protein
MGATDEGSWARPGQTLDRIRRDKKSQLTDYLTRIQANAHAISNDELMQRFFRIQHKFHLLGKTAPPPADARRAIAHLNKTALRHYLHNYIAFYDLLLVDRTGEIFYTMRGEGDLGANLFTGKLARSNLARQLKSDPEKQFIDYEYYEFSNRPSAFFVEPVRQDGKVIGWFLLQCTINKLNSIFSAEEALGQTGEVFLVNEKSMMLTQSRFRNESSSLRQHLSEENIRSKFKEGRGHKTVTDYRGHRAKTSFEVCDVLGARWLLIVKVDEDEILTRQYLQQKQKFEKPLLAELNRDRPEGRSPGPVIPPTDGLGVDVDEFQRVGEEGTLVTWGVHTCTAVVITLPGKFAYLGHLSNYDRSYRQGGNLDLLGHMLKRIRRFELYPVQMRDVEIVIVAPHTHSVLGAADRLLAEGFLLSQIRFVHCPDAHCATVRHRMKPGATDISWQFSADHSGHARQSASACPSLADLVRPRIHQ